MSIDKLKVVFGLLGESADLAKEEKEYLGCMVNDSQPD
jgi:hypothetical protein